MEDRIDISSFPENNSFLLDFLDEVILLESHLGHSQDQGVGEAAQIDYGKPGCISHQGLCQCAEQADALGDARGGLAV